MAEPGNSVALVDAGRGAAGRLAHSIRTSTIVKAASALFSSTMITSLLGFVFWGVVARLSTTSAVGSAAAAVSLMTLVGQFATLGFGSLLIAELGRRRKDPVELVVASAHLTAGFSAALAVLTAAVVAWSTDSIDLLHSPGGVALFAIGSVATTLGVVADHALVGAGLHGRQVMRNLVASATKLAVLPVMAMTVDISATTIYLAWTIGAVVSLVAVLARSSVPSKWVRAPHPRRALQGLVGQAVGHHAINVSGQLTGLVLPVLVAGLLGPEANARFYIALQIASFAWVVQLHLNTALFAVSSSEPSVLRREARMILQLTVLVTVAGSVGALLLGPPVLGVLGDDYRGAATITAILIAGTLPIAVLGIYVAVCRIQDRLGRGAFVLLMESLLQVAAATLAAALFGLTATAVALTLSSLVTAVFVWPAVARLIRSGAAPAEPLPSAPAGGSDLLVDRAREAGHEQLGPRPAVAASGVESPLQRSTDGVG